MGSVLLSLVPLLTAGQVFGTVSLTINDQTAIAVNDSQCDNTLTGQWTAALLGGVCSSMQLWITSASSCGDVPIAGDLVFPEVQQTLLVANRNQQGNVSFKVSDLPAFTQASADGGALCGSTGIDQVHLWCAAVTMSSDLTCFSKNVLHAATPVTIEYDTKPPEQPSVSTEPLDSSASLTMSVDSETDTIEIQDRPSGTTDFAKVNTVASSVTNTTIDNLENGKTYDVRIIAIDAAGNRSTPSDPQSVTPRASQGFWQACRDAGCPRGCSVAGGPVGLLGLGLLLVARRMRR